MSLLPSRTALSVAVAVSCSLSFPLFSAAPALGATQAADLDCIFVTGTRTSSKNTSLKPCCPESCVSGRTVTPGAFISTSR